ncbi:hypothetical protein Save01_03447 [Streptomyces avermitilis]|uniref:Uncharacterized protein n=1 Tax=Streptomyces avermitilis TaxID=33903 RepID=A0A4D4MG40_STRAX|nr:hypothetical protein SAV14893_080060 [Streptomyces avermitilis]GDY71012.1 hypothetical protein SAV31267_004970 [Streptomyces avermitilis]
MVRSAVAGPSGRPGGSDGPASRPACPLHTAGRGSAGEAAGLRIPARCWAATAVALHGERRWEAGVAGESEAQQGREGGAAYAGLQHVATPDRDAVGAGYVAGTAAPEAGVDGSSPPQRPKIRTISGPASPKEPHRPPFSLSDVLVRRLRTGVSEAGVAFWVDDTGFPDAQRNSRLDPDLASHAQVGPSACDCTASTLWAGELDALHEGFVHRFNREEPRQPALAYMRGMVAPLERKNGCRNRVAEAGDTIAGDESAVQHYMGTCPRLGSFVGLDITDRHPEREGVTDLFGLASGDLG